MDKLSYYPFRFTGTGGEYFRIWIVNIALTLVTLGIYSAWAKVRTNRWFYGHTLLANTSFDYLASPMQILKGRLIAVVLLIVYTIASKMTPLFALIVIVLFLIATPWIIVMALRFNARQSAYRGLRFNFTGTVGEAAIVYLLLPGLSFLTLGLLLPYTAYRQVRYLASHYAYGNSPSSYDGHLKPFWGVYLGALGMLLIPFVIAIVAIAGIVQMEASGMPKEVLIKSLGGIIFLAVLPIYFIIPLITAFITARKANLYYNHLHLERIGFESTQRARDLIWIYLSNLVLIFLTLGLFIPFAMVRLARYRAEHLVMKAIDLERFAAQSSEGVSATGSEISDVFDMDIGIA